MTPGVVYPRAVRCKPPPFTPARGASPCSAPAALLITPPPRVDSQAAEIDTRMELYQHVVLSGGSTMYPGE